MTDSEIERLELESIIRDFSKWPDQSIAKVYSDYYIKELLRLKEKEREEKTQESDKGLMTKEIFRQKITEIDPWLRLLIKLGPDAHAELQKKFWDKFCYAIEKEINEKVEPKEPSGCETCNKRVSTLKAFIEERYSFAHHIIWKFEKCKTCGSDTIDVDMILELFK